MAVRATRLSRIPVSHLLVCILFHAASVFPRGQARNVLFLEIRT